MTEISATFPFSDRPANSLVTTSTELPGVRKAIASSALSHVVSIRKERHGPKRKKSVEFQNWDFYRQVPRHASLVNDDVLCALPNLLFSWALETLSTSDDTAWNAGMNGHRRNRKQKATVAKPETTSWHLAGGTEVNNDNGTGQQVFGLAGELHNRQPWYTFVGGGLSG
jgi:hypothetical protein